MQWLDRQISYYWVPDSSPGPVETQFVVTDLEQITFTPCLLLVKPRKRWTDDRLGQTVMGLVSMLCLMCLVQDRDLVSRPDNMDETVPHTLTQISEKIPSQDRLCDK